MAVHFRYYPSTKPGRGYPPNGQNGISRQPCSCRLRPLPEPVPKLAGRVWVARVAPTLGKASRSLVETSDSNVAKEENVILILNNFYIMNPFLCNNIIFLVWNCTFLIYEHVYFEIKYQTTLGLTSCQYVKPWIAAARPSSPDLLLFYSTCTAANLTLITSSAAASEPK